MLFLRELTEFRKYCPIYNTHEISGRDPHRNLWEVTRVIAYTIINL